MIINTESTYMTMSDEGHYHIYSYVAARSTWNFIRFTDESILPNGFITTEALLALLEKTYYVSAESPRALMGREWRTHFTKK